ncbi:hypothetical protein Tco_0065657 [Tanacetum coccineum]
MKNDTVCKEKASNVFQKEREQYFKIQDLKAQLQVQLQVFENDKNIVICELKKIIEKCKGKSVETNFDKPSIVRQPNAQRIPKPSVLGKPTPFSDSLERKIFSKTKSVSKTNVSEGLSKTVTIQILPQQQGVTHSTNVSRPQLRSTQMKDKQQLGSRSRSYKVSTEQFTDGVEVLQGEDDYRDLQLIMCGGMTRLQRKYELRGSLFHSRRSMISTSGEALISSGFMMKASLQETFTCGKYVFNSNHDACVSKYLNDVNARTKKPKVVPISTRKPKSQVNKSVATHRKKTVASESTVQNSKSYYRMLYEKTSKAWKWWIEQQSH